MLAGQQLNDERALAMAARLEHQRFIAPLHKPGYSNARPILLQRMTGNQCGSASLR